MTLRSTVRLEALFGIAAIAAVTGCGGGGGSGTPAPAPAPAYPSSGSYAAVLKPQGSTTAPTDGLSLVHPSDTSVEYVIESASAIVTDMLTLRAGTATAASSSVTGLSARTLLYIVDGDIRRVPLAANGSAPAATRASSTDACRFVADENAENFGDPDASLLIVTTKGADNTCGTSDDGFKLVTLTGGAVAEGATTTVLGYLRSATTLAPAYSVTPLMVAPTSGSGSTLALNTNGNVARRIIASAASTMLIEWGSTAADSQIAVVSVDPYALTLLGTTLTGLGNWQAIGHDADNFYVYRNSGTTTTSTWTVLRINKAGTPAATVLATGTGLVSDTAMGQGLLYATVRQAAANKLFALSKTMAGTPTTIDSTPVSDLSRARTSAGSVHMIWRVVGTATHVDMVDENNQTLSTTAGGLPLTMDEPTTIDLRRSENRTRFVFAGGYGATAFSGATLNAYDAATGGSAPLLLGTLPGSATYGSDLVTASTGTPMGGFGAGHVARVSNNTVQADGARVFSFKADTAGSLAYTSTTR